MVGWAPISGFLPLSLKDLCNIQYWCFSTVQLLHRAVLIAAKYICTCSEWVVFTVDSMMLATGLTLQLPIATLNKIYKNQVGCYRTILQQRSWFSDHNHSSEPSASPVTLESHSQIKGVRTPKWRSVAMIRRAPSDRLNFLHSHRQANAD